MKDDWTIKIGLKPDSLGKTEKCNFDEIYNSSPPSFYKESLDRRHEMLLSKCHTKKYFKGEYYENHYYF